MDLEVLTPAIGAIVHGVDLREPLSTDDREGIHDALMQHLVLFFRDQPLTGEQQVATWRALPGKTMDVIGSTATPAQDITSVEVRAADGTPVLRLTT